MEWPPKDQPAMSWAVRRDLRKRVEMCRGDRGPDECWPWIGYFDDQGYGRFGKQTAHRAVVDRLVQPVPDGLMVLHSCDNHPCVNPAHLRIGTHAENMADVVERHRRSGMLMGGRNGQARLTEADVFAIVEATGTNAEIGARFHVSSSAVGAIRTGVTWSWLTGIGGAA